MAIYLDYNATTPADPRVVEQLLPYFTADFGNASSIDHAYGHAAREAVERAREQVASLIGAAAEEIIFTSGATEANNIAIFGVLARAPDDAEVITSAIEHPAVLEPASQFGARVRTVPVTGEGLVDPDEVRRHLTPKTALVCVMAANNETGAIQPIDEIGVICAERGIPFFSDAVQAAGRVAVDVDRAHLSLLSLSGHKLYGPKGIGALYVRRRGTRTKVAPLVYGGGHERGLRPGTLNVPGIVGLGAAAELATRNRDEEGSEQERLREELVNGIGRVGDITLNTPVTHSLPQTVNIRIAGVGARALMHATREELAFSAGSACSTTKAAPSHVLLAQGLDSLHASESIRLSFGRFTSRDELATAVEVLTDAVKALRAISGFRAA